MFPIDQTVANTSSETDCTGTLNLTAPAQYSGGQFDFDGVLSTDAAAPTLRVRAYLDDGSPQLIADSGAITMPTAQSNQPFLVR